MTLAEDEIVRLLAGIDLFEKFTPANLAVVAQRCRTLSLKPGEILFEYGQSGSALYIVVDGQLEVFRGERAIGRVSKNEYIGEMGLLDTGIRAASARAFSNTTLLEISRDIFECYLQNQPELLTAMMRTVTRRLRSVLDDTQAAYDQVNLQVHDMLNLLNVLTGAEFVAEALPATDEHQRYLEVILHTRDRLEVMMRDALRKASGRVVAYSKVPSNLESLVRQCLERDLALHPDVNRIDTLLRVGSPLSPCICNPLDIQRVVANLVINAAQAIQSKGRVTINLRQDEASTFIDVEDNGPGIAADVLPMIFNTHFTTKPNGTGLGLSSCRLIVEDLHGGIIRCASKVGEGATFTVEIPTGGAH